MAMGPHRLHIRLYGRKQIRVTLAKRLIVTQTVLTLGGEIIGQDVGGSSQDELSCDFPQLERGC